MPQADENKVTVQTIINNPTKNLVDRHQISHYDDKLLKYVAL